MPQPAFQRASAWCGIVCFALFFVAFALAGFVPPLSPSTPAPEVAEHYRSHATGVRLGGVVMMLSSMFYAPYTALISAQLRRIPGSHRAVAYTQLTAGAFGCLTFLLPGMLFAVTAFRPERSVELTELLNDMSWLILVMPWPPFMAQNFAFAFGILTDPRRRPLFPRWLAYLNIWVPLMFVPDVLLPFFRSGAFAWNGIVGIWIPAIVFVIQFLANTAMLLRAISTTDAEPKSPHPCRTGASPRSRCVGITAVRSSGHRPRRVARGASGRTSVRMWRRRHRCLPMTRADCTRSRCPRTRAPSCIARRFRPAEHGADGRTSPVPARRRVPEAR